MGSQSRTQLSDFTFTFHFHALEKEMATHFSVLAWRISGTVEPGGLPSIGVAQGRTRLKRLSSNPCWKYCSPKGNTFKSMGIYWASWYKKTSAGKVWWIRGQIQCGVPAGETGQKNLWCGTILGLGASLVAQMVKNLPALQKTGLDPWVGKILWRKEWLPTPVFLPGEFHGQGSLVGYSHGVAKGQTWLSDWTTTTR